MAEGFIRKRGFNIFDRIQTSFAWKKGPINNLDSFKNSWDSGFHQGTALDSDPTDGITIIESGYYYVEGHQRAANTENRYFALSQNGDRALIEDRTSGGWIHDHAAQANRFSHSKYIGYLEAGEKISGGPNITQASGMRWSSSQLDGFIFVLKIDASLGGNFSSVFMDYAWCDGANSFNSAHKTNYNVQGGFGESLETTAQGIKVLRDGWYWFESGHRSTGSEMSTIFSIDGDVATVNGKNNILWSYDVSGITNSHAHGHMIGYFTSGQIITSGPVTATGAHYSDTATGWSAFIRGIRIDNGQKRQDGNDTSRTLIDHAWALGPESYNAKFRMNYARLGNNGTGISEHDIRSLNVNETGHYFAEHHQRMASTTNSYGVLSDYGDREILEDNDNGMWTHDHNAFSGNYYHSRWLGPNTIGQKFSGGPVSNNSTTFMYRSNGWAGAIFVMKMK